MQILIDLMWGLIDLTLGLIGLVWPPIALLGAVLVGYALLGRRSRKRLMPIEESMHGLQISVRYSTGAHHSRSHGSE